MKTLGYNKFIREFHQIVKVNEISKLHMLL